MIVVPPPPSNPHLIAAATVLGARKASADAGFDRFLRLFPLRVGLLFLSLGGVFAGLALLLPAGLYTLGLFIGAGLAGLIGAVWVMLFYFEARK